MLPLSLHCALCQLPELPGDYVPWANIQHVLGILAASSSIGPIFRPGLLRLGMYGRAGYTAVKQSGAAKAADQKYVHAGCAAL